MLQGSDDFSSDQSRESSPLPATLSLTRRTIDDERGTRCFNRWPFRYFGECTEASEILDAYDSVYPRQVARIGVKYQALLLTWHEQESLGLGVRVFKDVDFNEGGILTPMTEDLMRSKRLMGRPAKKKKEETPGTTPILPHITLPTPAVTNGAMEIDNQPLARLVIDKEIERGTDESVDAIYLPGNVEEKTVDKYLKVCKKQLPEYANQIGLIDRALTLLTRYKGEAGRALHELTNSSNEELEVDTWTPKEAKQFDRIISDYNADLRMLKREIPTKTSAQLVRHFAQWKCKRLASQFEKAKAQDGTDKGVKSDTSSNNGEQSTRAVSPSLSVMDDNSSNPQTQLPSKLCKICTTSTSSIWYKGPISWHNRRLCVNCGLYWRKYAAEMPSSHLDMITTRKRDADEAALGVAPPVKAAKLTRSESSKGVSPLQTTSSTIALEPSKCVMCRKLEPKKRLAQCRQCGLSIHQGCYGLTKEEVASEMWFCEVCSNERAYDAALTPQCILCPRIRSLPLISIGDDTASLMRQPPPLPTLEQQKATSRPRKNTSASLNGGGMNLPPMGALDAIKPTESNNWAHVYCALFIPEITFTEPQRMRTVEGAGFLPNWRYEATCDLCNHQEGACVGCADSSCKRFFHASCASQQPTFTLGLDLAPVKSTRRDTTLTTTFKGETGHMTALIYCNLHKETARSRNLIDLAEIDPVSGSTATITFAQSHKAVKSLTSSQNEQNSYPLLRKAKRFDAIFAGTLSSSTGVAQNSFPTLSKKVSKQTLATRPPLPLLTSAAIPSAAGRDGVSSSSMDEISDDKSLISRRLLELRENTTKNCVRCKTQFSPFWWDVPKNVKEGQEGGSTPDWIHLLTSVWTPPEQVVLCVRCRHAVLPPLTM
ncbi:hypothetical protein CBS101457_003683 [Exobasidium rhododendri]|nr:hypothetical protein CBS101457_003683 [Exobasidium rhododendri]